MRLDDLFASHWLRRWTKWIFKKQRPRPRHGRPLPQGKCILGADMLLVLSGTSASGAPNMPFLVGIVNSIRRPQLVEMTVDLSRGIQSV